MTEREKMIEILKQTSDLWKEEESHGYIVSVDLGKIADTLIEAGIGNVTEWKERAEKHRVQVLPDGTIKQLYGDEEVEDIARQRDEWKERAEKEKTEKNKLKCTANDWKQRFESREKQLAELRTTSCEAVIRKDRVISEQKSEIDRLSTERDEYRKSTHIALRGIEILKRNILRYFATEFPSILRQAEREIEEEGKDEQMRKRLYA